MSKKTIIFKPKKFKDPDKAFEYVRTIYEANTEYLRDSFETYCCNSQTNVHKVRAYYPYIKVTTKLARRSDSRFSYGFASKPGTYMTTLTRPDFFDLYYKEQFMLLIKNHDVPIEIGTSSVPIPLHFGLGENFHLENDLTEEQVSNLPQYFDVPDLNILDDEIANATYIPRSEDEARPLALFTAPRIDISFQRLKHYCGSDPSHFQNYILFTNYQFYIDEFVKMCHEMMSATDNVNNYSERKAYSAFVEPGNKITINKNIPAMGESNNAGENISRLPQMPAYHLKMPDGSGITMINIGVGPSNAKTITDHVAVIRPHAWLMLGHCAGLRGSQRLGDYVLAHGYLREDNILDEFLPTDIPIPALAEIQQALEEAVAHVTGQEGYDLKKIMRTGTVATTDDRNWELKSYLKQNTKLSQSRAIALDMESGTIAANGFRFRVPYGTLLCVSDKPLHGQLKLPGMADNFYRERVEQHLKIGLKTMALLRDLSPEKLHSRKLRSFDEPAFQ
ncbi:MAG: AMP nucleosidase [Alphaproteobacteria bacterium]|nr:AMP nucleosidase [Alphaproteobacteria bacterium]